MKNLLPILFALPIVLAVVFFAEHDPARLNHKQHTILSHQGYRNVSFIEAPGGRCREFVADTLPFMTPMSGELCCEGFLGDSCHVQTHEH